MTTITKSTLVAAGLRGLLCAGIATLITGFFSWSFVASTESMDWMGSGGAYSEELA